MRIYILLIITFFLHACGCEGISFASAGINTTQSYAEFMDVKTNFVKNPFARINTNSVTTSSATKGRDTTNKLFGIASHICQASAQAGYCEYTLNTITSPHDSQNLQCEAQVLTKGDASLYRLQLLNSSGTVVSQTDVLGNNTDWRVGYLIYPCQSSPKIRITQTESGTGGTPSLALYYGPTVHQTEVQNENKFTALISSSGVISHQTGGTWLSSCTTSTGNIGCTPVSNFFTSTPNCSATPNTSGGSGYIASYIVGSSSATSLAFGLTSGGTSSSAFGIIISCTKTESDSAQAAVSANTPRHPTHTRLTSGSGTYTLPLGVRYIVVEMVGGGGGGAGSGSGGSAAGAGGSTTFGTSLLTATGGGAGTYNAGGYGGAAGSTTINSPAILIANPTSEAGGGNWCNYGASLNYVPSGKGGSTFFAGGGASATNSAGYWASANTGGGGSGGAGSGTASTCTGGGGGGGGYLKAQINNPSSSYTYSIGAGGTAGGAGTNGYAGGAGGSGVIIVHEYYGENLPVIVGDKIVARYTKSSTQTISHNNNTSVTGWTKDFDDLNVFNPSTGDFTAPKDMKVQVCINITFASNSVVAAKEYDAYIIQQGSANKSSFPGSYYPLVNSASNTFVKVNGCDLYSVKTGDTLTIGVYQNTGASQTIYANSGFNFVTFSEQ